MDAPYLLARASVPGRVLLSSGRYICFGPFRVDQQKQEVSRDGIRLRLQGKVYQTLLALLEKSGEVVTREELRVRLWTDTHVNYDANVNTIVNKLRHALVDSSDSPTYIETISKKGYLFLVRPEVSSVPANQPCSGEEPPGCADVTPRIVAASGSSAFNSWTMLGAIGLILAGVILGAAIASMWINHASRLPCAVAGRNLSSRTNSVTLTTAAHTVSLQNLEVRSERLPFGVSPQVGVMKSPQPSATRGKRGSKQL